MNRPDRRRFLCQAASLAALGLIEGCTTVTPTPQTQLPAGVSLRLIAPSGLLQHAENGQRAVSRLSAAGFAVSNQACLVRRYQRFAGTDAERLAELADIASGKVDAPQVLLAARGGYGVMRLLPQLDLPRLGARLKESGTLFIGYSDITALQLALQSKAALVSFAGPMVYSDFGAPQADPYAMHQFAHAVTQADFTVRVTQPQRHTLRASGTLWGGNLSVIAALVGTPYLPDVRGGLLFLEDVGEQPYQIERMLQTLFLAGVLQKQRAIILGQFGTENIRDSYDPGYTLDVVAQQIRTQTGVPVLTGFPFGHVKRKTTLPLGAEAELVGDGAGYSVRFGQAPRLDAGALRLETLYQPQPA